MICLLGEINRFLQWKFTLALIHVHLLANITLTLNCTNFCTFTYPPIYHFHLLTNINFAFTCTLMALSLSLPKGPDHKIPVFYGFPNKCCAILPPFGRALISLSASYWIKQKRCQSLSCINWILLHQPFPFHDIGCQVSTYESISSSRAKVHECSVKAFSR